MVGILKITPKSGQPTPLIFTWLNPVKNVFSLTYGLDNQRLSFSNVFCFPATLKGETLAIPRGAIAPGFVAPKLEVPINGFTY